MPVKERMMAIVTGRDWDALRTALDRMTNMEFRRAERVVREEVLPTLPNDLFWDTLLHLVMYRRQAFLSGVVCVGRLAESGELDFSVEPVTLLADYLRRTSPQALHKMVRMALPALCGESQIMGVFSAFGVDDERDRVAALIRVATPASYFVLLRTLRRIDDNHELARKCCVFLLKKGDDLSFNMASIMREYFGLENIKSQLSLSVSPYELSYLEHSYEKFVHVLTGKRPRIWEG